MPRERRFEFAKIYIDCPFSDGGEACPYPTYVTHTRILNRNEIIIDYQYC